MRAHIFAGALLWFTFDIVIYSTVLFGPSLIAKGLGMTGAGFTLLMDLAFIMPAMLIGSFFLLDRFGRKPVQICGYIGAAIVLIVFACLHQHIAHNPVLGLVLFGPFNVLAMGPSMVSGSGMLGVELAPTRIRTVAQSITVVGGRLGASLSAFVFPVLFVKLGEDMAIGLLAGVSIVGAILTQFIIPETAGRSLEDLSGEPMEAARRRSKGRKKAKEEKRFFFEKRTKKLSFCWRLRGALSVPPSRSLEDLSGEPMEVVAAE